MGWTGEDYAEFLNTLKLKVKDESVSDRQRHIAILNTKQYVYGLRMADIRSLAKSILKSDYMSFLKIAKNDSYEETLIQGLVIAGVKDLEVQQKLLTEWIKNVDNWSACDSVVSTLKTLKISKEKNKLFDGYKSLCFSSGEFTARLGIIVLMSCYLSEEFIDEILNMCKQVTNDKYYVQMGLAWLLSFAFIKFKDKTYMLLNQKILPKFVQNKAICKCRDSYQVSSEDKQKLKNLRI